MKSISKKIGLIMLLPLLMGLDIGIDITYYQVTSDVLTCPNSLNEQNLKLIFYNSVVKNLTLKVYAYNNKTDALFSVDTYNLTLSPTVSVEQLVTIPLKNHLTGGGVRIQFDESSKVYSHSASAVLYPYTKQNINVRNFRHDPFVYQNCFLKYENGEFFTDESFDFTNLNEFLAIEEGNVLDLSNISFGYSQNLDFNCDNIKLHIMDYGNVFSELNKVADELVFNMKKTVENGVVTLELDEELYVNKKTLELSKKDTKGYIPTNDIYIPVGKELLFEQNEVFITIENAGYSLTNFTIPFTYYFSSREVGQCYESDYCITGGIVE